ncbi:uncharacterized protein LOC141680292 [Apium graveolens]|uniref:uncharacterized protein LOC141680292 n=1 Tax=Apium graveolens TaxID=4045 RepID=UPI003D7AB7A5
MGFRELGKFNLTMLAKQGWRLLNNENSLVTAMMKARYFPYGDFLVAAIEELEDTTVSILMMDGKNILDDDILNDICNMRDVELIKRIPLPVRNLDDSWFWMREENGHFTVKSCYRKLHGEFMRPQDNFWKHLWALELPGKVKDESEVHVLFECQFSRSLWEASGYQDNIQAFPNERNIRNRWVWDKMNMSVFGVKAAMLHLLYDWKKAQIDVSKYKPVLDATSREWRKPNQGWVKLNIDVATFEDIRSVNGVAHVLARATHSISYEQEWNSIPRKFISEALIFILFKYCKFLMFQKKR